MKISRNRSILIGALTHERSVAAAANQQRAPFHFRERDGRPAAKALRAHPLPAHTAIVASTENASCFVPVP